MASGDLDSTRRGRDGRRADVEQFLTLIRTGAVMVYIGLIVLSPPELVAYREFGWLVAVTAAIYTVVLAIGYRQAPQAVSTGSDAALALGAVASTGAGQSPFLGVLFLVVSEAALRFDRRTAIAVGSAIALCLALIVLLLPEPRLPMANRLVLAFGSCSMLVLGAALVGFLRRREQLEQTAAVQAETQARATEAFDRELHELVRVVVHELRAPTASLTALARSLLGTSPTITNDTGHSDDTTKKLELIYEQSVHLSRFEERLRATISSEDLSAFNTAHPKPMRIQEQLAAAVTAAAALHDRTAPSLDVADELPQLAIDHEKLRQIVTNLVDNALRHSPDPDTVEVVAMVIGADLYVEVRDRGPGLPSHLRDQLPESSISSPDGLFGLGLWISKNLAAAMGGTLTAHARVEGGLVMMLRVPARAPEPEAESTPESPTADLTPGRTL